MVKLLWQVGGTQQELALKPGVNRIGRNSGNDFQINEASVSSFHCEIIWQNDSILVRDLGSTNGTFIDGRRVEEAVLQPGQRLQLGGTELRLELPTAGTSLTALPPRIAVLHQETAPPPVIEVVSDRIPTRSPDDAPLAPAMCRYHPKNIARQHCPKCNKNFCEMCVSTRPSSTGPLKVCRKCGSECTPIHVELEAYIVEEKTFWQVLPSVFAFPFRNNGWFMMICATFLYTIMEICRMAPIGFYKWWGWVLMMGYLCAYMQKIMVHSGQGENEMPPWPDVTSIWSDVIFPLLLLFGTVLICMLPGLLAVYFTADSESLRTLVIPLFVFAGIYFPMALLVVGMTDNIFSVNPLIVIPSMVKILGPYLITCLFLGVLVGVKRLGDLLIGMIPIPLLPIPFFGFVTLYFLSVEMRLLGVLYYTNRNVLGWFKH